MTALERLFLRLMAERGIAEVPVDFGRLPAFRAEHFPLSGPAPWLDREHETIEDPQLRFWAERGYLILPKLIPDGLLDEAWKAYEDAVSVGKIPLPAESA